MEKQKMYVERDAKIVLIYGSVIGIIWFVSFYILLSLNQAIIPTKNLNIVQLMMLGIITILAVILTVSVYSLKKEISSQEECLKNREKTVHTNEKYVQIPYNKAGLYSIIVSSAIGIIVFLLLYNYFILQPQELSNMNLEMLSSMILIFIIILSIVLLITFFILMRRIRMPLYYSFKACPQCGSDDIHKVEYSWWGGLIGPYLVHQVRCKKCGKTYDGVTGTNITTKIGIFFAIMIAVLTILELLTFILEL
jgi:hypothetical protein